MKSGDAQTSGVPKSEDFDNFGLENTTRENGLHDISILYCMGSTHYI